MEVWVVLDGYDYEGYGPPCGIFSTKEKAVALRAKIMAREYPPDSCEIFKFLIDDDDFVERIT